MELREIDPAQAEGTPANHGQPDPAAAAFYGGALHRIRRFMLVLGAAATVASFGMYGWQVSLGVLAGCAIAYANFYWLEEVVRALADRATAPSANGTRESSGGIVARFLLRYALIALGAYVIFKISLASLYGLLGGLFLTVGAILCEGVYEAYAALRRGY